MKKLLLANDCAVSGEEGISGAGDEEELEGSFKADSGTDLSASERTSTVSSKSPANLVIA